jgi:hypothetical protein
MLDPKRFAEFIEARANAGDGYIMCAVGQDPKTLNEWYFSGQYSGMQLEQAYTWREEAQRVWDCQGLADGYLTEVLKQSINVRARNNYAAWCDVKGSGDIPAERRVPGAAVFMHNGDYIHHVGFLIRPIDPARPHGDWWIGEARGVMYGVVLTKLSARKWNRWGWMTKYFQYELAVDDVPAEYGHRNLYIGKSGDDVAALQADLISLNYSCGKWGADGDFGKATDSALRAFQHDHGLVEDGVAGPNTYAKLNELLVDDGDMKEPEEPVKGILISAGSSWNVRTQPNGKAAVMGYAKRGELYAGSGQTADGWIGIIYNDELAWISAKAIA